MQFNIESAKMEIILTDKALKQLQAIAKGSKQDAQKILNKIETYAQNPRVSHNTKTLKGNFGYRLRLRVGDYRVVFKHEENTLTVSIIKHRKDVYND